MKVLNKQSIAIILVIICFLVNLISSCPNYPEPIKLDQNDPTLQKAYKEVDSIIQKGMKDNGIKSFIASIVYRDEIVWSKTYGNVNPLDENSPPLTIDNAIRIASITKTFTDLMMFQLRDKGTIDSLDDEISKYFPEFSIGNPYNTKKSPTFRELSSHQSGLPREVPCDFDDLADEKICSEEVIVERLSKMFLIMPSYQTTHYSNLGIALLGRTLAKAANTEYEKYVKEKILFPLGMLNSSYYYDDVKDYLAQGTYLLSNGSYAIAPVEELGWGNPMGNLYSTARDMSNYMMFWLNNENSNILDSTTVNEAMSPISLVNDGDTVYGTPFEMFYDQTNNMWVKSKAGQLLGYRTQMALIKPLKIGMLFSSLYAFETPDVFTKAAAEILIPVYEQLLYEAGSQPQSLVPDFNLQPDISKSTEKEPKKIPDEAFVGTYTNSEGSVFIVDNSTGVLIANFGDDNLFNVSRFSDQYPEILRIKVSNPEDYACWYVVDGSNYELVYFTIESTSYGGIECNSVTAMGQTMSLTSKDPHYLKNNNIFLEKRNKLISKFLQ
ncbi:hypothetical protein RB653_005411 [Dictyostelium firmibasis]|uniref:Beta-lactamase-related domain-containing protein n=1 Tax=Dictyostelium firmibasis TaxID=79012 RepID=A0AAN7U190_9MYCE